MLIIFLLKKLLIMLFYYEKYLRKSNINKINLNK